jgi:hypothetical protein
MNRTNPSTSRPSVVLSVRSHRKYEIWSRTSGPQPGSEVWRHRAGGGLRTLGLSTSYRTSNTHERFGSSSDPFLNGQLFYPAPVDIDKMLNEAAANKIRDYRADYNNPTSNSISFMPAVASTSGRFPCALVRILFLRAHRETFVFPGSSDPLSSFAASGVVELIMRNTTRTSFASTALLLLPAQV